MKASQRIHEGAQDLYRQTRRAAFAGLVVMLCLGVAKLLGGWFGSADAGGGIDFDGSGGGELTIINDTIAFNVSALGGGISCNTIIFTNAVYVGNSIVAKNIANTNPEVSLNGGDFDDLGHNLVFDDSEGLFINASDLLGVDPKLGPLASNGGPTKTLALLKGSPAINAADDSLAPSTDQRGVTRPKGAHSDIGAFERKSDGS